jgi:hypothetical protein
MFGTAAEESKRLFFNPNSPLAVEDEIIEICRCNADEQPVLYAFPPCLRGISTLP